MVRVVAQAGRAHNSILLRKSGSPDLGLEPLTIIQIDPSPRAVVDHVRLYGGASRQKLRVARYLLRPEADVMHVIELNDVVPRVCGLCGIVELR